MNHEIRIIAGIHKGFKLNVLNKEGLRPTIDRARETIFNYIGDVQDFTVLDLFAGTGVLGFEALSRGAERCDLVEQDRDIYLNLANNISRLNVAAYAHQVNAIDFLVHNKQKYDLIFMDPPFNSDLYDICLRNVKKNMHVDTILYVEKPIHKNIKFLGYEVMNHGVFGQSEYFLLKKSSLI